MKRYHYFILAGLVTLTAIFVNTVTSEPKNNAEKVKMGKEMAFATTTNNFSNDSSKINEKEADLNSQIVKLNAELEALEDEVEVVHEEVQASYYHDKFNGRKTANGEVFNNNKYTAAHKSLPFGTKVRVTNLKNDREVIVEINDRGPFVKGRNLDLSKSAFMDIASNKSKGVLTVKVEVLPEDYEIKKTELQEELNIIASVPEDLDLNEFAL
ncbi:septal ring lytic transglycosylase RlpA family protein [Myroides sp. JBRI-B21084]|uniref:septal ring lytic transglycosylase RlpA family protein n=1 Tax=Myroides sp. JBRI-B21084 TaxID=3119977 RepID=UPI003FA5C5AE